MLCMLCMFSRVSMWSILSYLSLSYLIFLFYHSIILSFYLSIYLPICLSVYSFVYSICLLEKLRSDHKCFFRAILGEQFHRISPRKSSWITACGRSRQAWTHGFQNMSAVVKECVFFLGFALNSRTCSLRGSWPPTWNIFFRRTVPHRNDGHQ
jgi:hypothetical protein